MASCTKKIDSNIAETRFADEVLGCGGMLPPTPTWDPAEPNSFGDFGAAVSRTARAPINAGRQRLKGSTTDLDANANFEQDLTLTNWRKFARGFFYSERSDAGEFGGHSSAIAIDATNDEFDISGLQVATVAINVAGTGYVPGDVLVVGTGTATEDAWVAVTDTNDSTGAITGVRLIRKGAYTVAPSTSNGATTGGSGSSATLDTTTETYLGAMQAGDLLLGADFVTAAHNALHVVQAITGTTTKAVESDVDLGAETVPAAAKLWRVGHEEQTADALSITGATNTLTSTSGVNFTTLGLEVGEWIYIGGDAAANKFVNAGNNGFCRIATISATALTFDKTQGIMTDETPSSGAAEPASAIRLFFGDHIRNQQLAANQIKQTYQGERYLGNAGYQYVTGCTPNTCNFRFDGQTKVITEMGFVGFDQTTQASTKSGTRPTLESGNLLNTTSDFARLRVADSSDNGLATYVTQFNVQIDNGVTAVKAIGTLGAIDTNLGDFVVSGTITALFSSTDTIAAVRNNTDLTLDFGLVRDNGGIYFDVPLFGGGGGLPNVTKDEPITIPVEMEAGKHSTLGYTMSMTFFKYLPTAAAA